MPVNSFENYPMSWKPDRKELSKPYYLSIASLLEQDIRIGRLPEHTKLPPQRELADYLDLNLSTITRAYKMCELKGLLYAVTGRGTFVSPGITAGDTFIPQSVKLIEMGMIKPFYDCNDVILEAAQEVLRKPEAAALFEYGEPLGTHSQKEAASQWLRRIGIDAGCDRIILAEGAQNALSVILISLFQAGDKIAVDTFTYTNFRGLANLLQIQLVAVEGDRYGMSPEALENACRQTGIKGIYLMPSCNNPTGSFMPADRRAELCRLIREYNILVIEDDIYSFLAPSGVKPFAVLLPEQTVHVCSVSKSLCAGLRVAFVAFPERYARPLLSGTLNINLKTVSLNAEIIAELIRSGTAERIVKRKIQSAESRNEIYRQYFVPAYEDAIPRFFQWLRLPEGLTGEAFEMLAFQRGVHILGSHRFAMRGEGQASYARLSLTSQPTEEELHTGLGILREILGQYRAGYEIELIV